jgi:protein-arginine kinase activator protein McsA
MYGECENCGRNATLECSYNPSTGQEIYICETCSENMSQKEKQELADRP